MPISFTLVNTTHTKNRDWFEFVREKTSDYKTAMYTALHTGSKLDLNVYSVSKSLLTPGWSTTN